MAKSLAELGVSIGLWNVVDGKVGILIFPDTSKTGVDVSVELANVTLALSPAAAAQLNGHALEQQNITAIGAGALGSQTILNLVRSGYGQWTVVDNDRLLPHNLARHVLDGEFVGRNKALSLQHVGNTLFTDPIIPKAISSDVLKLTADEIGVAFGKASAIVDFSASLPVARHLTHHVNSPARRVSMFLNPTGTDLVILAEDARRSMSLDLIEMQYYRALISNPELVGHLQNPPGRLRYAYSCRDITSNIPQDYVAIHSGIAARAMRQVLAQNKAVIKVWRIDPATLKVTAIGVTPSPGIVEKRGAWTCVFDQAFLHKLHLLRNSKLPKETGGVLLGAFDVSRKIVYLVDTIPSPPDSEEWPTIYIRGNQGLATSVEQVSASTMKMIEYVGEWHSHPDNCACRPSTDDKKVFGWLTDLMDLDGLPACMIIVGEKQQTAMFLGQMLKQ